MMGENKTKFQIEGKTVSEDDFLKHMKNVTDRKILEVAKNSVDFLIKVLDDDTLYDSLKGLSEKTSDPFLVELTNNSGVKARLTFELEENEES